MKPTKIIDQKKAEEFSKLKSFDFSSFSLNFQVMLKYIWIKNVCKVLLLIYDLNYLTPNLCPRWELPFPLAVRFYKTNMNDCYRNSYFNGLLHRNELIGPNPL